MKRDTFSSSCLAVGGLVALVLVIAGCASAGGMRAPHTELLPGVEFHSYSEPLTGRLVFTYAEIDKDWTSPGLPAKVYSYDLRTRTLDVVVETPAQRNAQLFVAPDASTFCVLYGGYARATNALLYFERNNLKRYVQLPRMPDRVVFVGGHIFFQIREHGEGETLWQRIVEYNPMTDWKRYLELPGASRWKSEVYEFPIGRAERLKHELKFRYSTRRERLSIGVDYPQGVYRYDVATGEFAFAGHDWPGLDFEDEERTADGHYLLFSDRYEQDLYNPRMGRSLVASPRDHLESRSQDPEGRELTRLVRFPWPWLMEVRQMSPCRRFVLVRRVQVRSRPKGAWTYTYYVVDATTGAYFPLLRDDTDRRGTHRMGHVEWIAGDGSEPQP
jgi:hypothetical protein